MVTDIVNKEAQCQKTLKVLRAYESVPVWYFPVVIGILKHTNRISELKRKGYNIVNRKWYENGQCKSEYRLFESPMAV